MPVQYLYPVSDGPIVSSYMTANDSTRSNLYSYIDEGVSIYNDSDYICSSGLNIGNVTFWREDTIGNKLSELFNCGEMQVTPSSVTVNFRATYEPGLTSGTIDTHVYVTHSGYNNHADSLAGFDSIIASSLVPTTISSGTGFTTYTVDLDINRSNARCYNRYNNIGLAFDNRVSNYDNNIGLFKISAAEISSSGEYLRDNGIYQTIPGNIYLLREILPIYDCISGNFKSFDSEIYKQYTFDDKVIYNERVSRLSNTNLPQYNVRHPFSGVRNECLSSGDFKLSEVFTDHYFKFDTIPSGINNEEVFVSKNSSGLLRVRDLHGGSPSGFMYTGNSRTGGFSSIKSDSYIDFFSGFSGIFNFGFNPSGDFSIFVGGNIDGPPGMFGGTFAFSYLTFLNNKGFALGLGPADRIFKAIMNRNINASDLTEQDALIVTHNYGSPSGLLKLYARDLHTGYVHLLTSGLANVAYPSYPLFLNNISGDGFGFQWSLQNSRLYEFGIVNSGLSEYDISRLQPQRNRLLDSIQSNLNVPIDSGSHHITYESYETRSAYNGLTNNQQLFISDSNPGFNGGYVIDGSANDAIVTRYHNSYTDIIEPACVSGQSELFYQPGTAYFSGWLDASTTNPSGLLDNNLVIRISKNGTTSGIINFGDIDEAIVTYVRERGLETSFTLQSGLNLYTQELTQVNQYYDTYRYTQALYYNTIYPPSSIYRVDYFDKTDIKHLNLNNANINMFFAGNNDPYNQGYKDTVKIYSQAIIVDDWYGPLSSGIDLFIEGTIPTGINDSINLYIDGVYLTQSGLDLSITAPLPSTSGLDLFLDAQQTMSGLDLYVSGPTYLSSGLNFVLCNNTQLLSSSIPLYLQRDEYPTRSGSIPLSMWSSTNSGVFGGFDMFTNAVGVSHNFPLYLQQGDIGGGQGSIPLYIDAGGNIYGNVPLSLAQSGGEVAGMRKLFIRGTGLYDGSSFLASGFPLYIGDGKTYSESVLPLFLSTVDGSSSGISLSLVGGTYISSGINLSIPSTVGIQSGILSYYINGF